MNDQFHFNEQAALFNLLNETLPEQARILEVGSWTGASTTVLATLARSRGAQVFCVDTWRGTRQTHLEPIADKRDIFGEFKSNLDVDGLLPWVVPIVGDCDTVLPLFRDEAFDAIFIDAEHRYSAVRRNIVTLLPCLRQGGIMIGHDAEYKLSSCTPEKQKLIRECRESDYSEMLKCHAGVILALHEIFKDKHLLIDTRLWTAPDSLVRSALDCTL